MATNFTATDIQRAKLEKLMQNIDKPIEIPQRPKENKFEAPPDFIRNIMGSSAGAGSGEFHVYRHLRRKEYARQRYIEEQAKKEEMDREFRERAEDKKRLAEERTAKKRAKRLKKKQNARKKSTKKSNSDQKKTKEDTDEDEENSDEDESDEEIIGPTPPKNCKIESETSDKNETTNIIKEDSSEKKTHDDQSSKALSESESDEETIGPTLPKHCKTASEISDQNNDVVVIIKEKEASSVKESDEGENKTAKSESESDVTGLESQKETETASFQMDNVSDSVQKQ